MLTIQAEAQAAADTFSALQHAPLSPRSPPLVSVISPSPSSSSSASSASPSPSPEHHSADKESRDLLLAQIDGLRALIADQDAAIAQMGTLYMFLQFGKVETIGENIGDLCLKQSVIRCVCLYVSRIPSSVRVVPFVALVAFSLNCTITSCVLPLFVFHSF